MGPEVSEPNVDREYREGRWAHAERSKAYIMNAAVRAQKHRLAVLLCAGKRDDLPLADLAKGFERVVVVDINAQELPPRLVPGEARADLLVSAMLLAHLDPGLQQAHIDALLNQADLAVLTSEVTHHVTAYVPGGSDRETGESWSLIGGSTLEKRIPASMEIAGSNSWSWPRIRAQGRKPGARLDVTALSLRQRGSS